MTFTLPRKLGSIILLAVAFCTPALRARESRESRLVMTVLEARVPAEQLANVERVFGDGMTPLPLEIVESYLVRDATDHSLFRLTTVWRSMEALQAMRQAGVKPKGILMFETVGATPVLSIYNVVVHRKH